MYKTIFHLDEEEKITDVLRNINNLLQDMESEGEKIEIEVLANSNGVKAFKKNRDKNRDKIKNVLEKNVKIALCNNSLKKLELTKEDFIDEAFIVTSGVGELTRKQYNEWAYIKP
ncbi:MAG: DsrE family protein [Desulfobacterium sp.]|jgi:intracellular sulfur oxidation DsrE/DsrF family protein|nr:DsrE family protein [Desulfobacterium sp.]